MGQDAWVPQLGTEPLGVVMGQHSCKYSCTSGLSHLCKVDDEPSKLVNVRFFQVYMAYAYYSVKTADYTENVYYLSIFCRVFILHSFSYISFELIFYHFQFWHFCLMDYKWTFLQ